MLFPIIRKILLLQKHGSKNLFLTSRINSLATDRFG